MPFRFSLLALLALLAPAATAQPAPAGERLLRQWLAHTREATAALAAVAVTEERTRTVDGPAGTQRLRTVSDLRLAPPDEPDADVRVAELDGRRVLPVRLALVERRLRLAYGPGYLWITRPQLLARTFLEGMRPTGTATLDAVDGTPAWRVALEPASDAQLVRGTAWFARAPVGGAPRLLRFVIEGGMPPGGSAVVTTDYARIEGLDLPLHSRSDVVLRQRRRLRDYTVLLAADAHYSDHTVTTR